MTKTRNNKYKYNQYKIFNKTKKNRKYNHRQQIYKVPNLTPYYIDEVSQMISDELNQKENPSQGQNVNLNSYSPSINKELVLLQSAQRQRVHNCNNINAFKLKAPLQVGLPGRIYGKTCVPYNNTKAIKFLLKNLSANKHVNPDNIVPPMQSQSNCWFNTMFVSLLVSDKGRKFFHFFRQLMIEGSQSNGKAIPTTLRNGFALLNYAIDACLTGSKYAYDLDTNAIIQNIYDAIPEEYKSKLPYITNVDKAGNPIRYYLSLISYLHNKSLQLLFIKEANQKWKDKIIADIKPLSHLPHIIVLEFYDDEETTNKPKSFNIQGAKYALDSCVIRDTSKQHFCCVLTCEGKEMAYDGMSFHRLVPLEWKNKINSDITWEFEGSNNSDGKPLKWNFLQGYQMLLYYRVK